MAKQSLLQRCGEQRTSLHLLHRWAADQAQRQQRPPSSAGLRRIVKFVIAPAIPSFQAVQSRLPRPQPPSRTWTLADDEAGRPAGLHPAAAAKWECS